MQVLLTERFDEGLALLQKMLKWDPVDITYCAMLPTKAGMMRWDGKPLKNIPKISELPPEVTLKLDYPVHGGPFPTLFTPCTTLVAVSTSVTPYP